MAPSFVATLPFNLLALAMQHFDITRSPAIRVGGCTVARCIR